MSSTLDQIRKDGDDGVVALLAMLHEEVTRPEPGSDALKRVDHALVKLGKPALPKVVATLRDPSEPVNLRAESARVLSRVEKTKSIFAIVEVLAKALESNPSPLGARLVEVLGDVGDPRPLPALQKALIHEDSSVRFAAALALGKIGDPAVVLPLISALNDRDVVVQAAANRSLMKLSGTDQGFSSDLPDADRMAAITRWNAWWLQNKSHYKPPPPPALREIWEHADEILSWAILGKALPSTTQAAVFPGFPFVGNEPIYVSTANLPEGTLPVVEGRRIILKAEKDLIPVPKDGYWRFEDLKTEGTTAALTLTYVLPEGKTASAEVRFRREDEDWTLDSVHVKPGSTKG
jgi:hypothetical protein